MTRSFWGYFCIPIFAVLLAQGLQITADPKGIGFLEFFGLLSVVFWLGFGFFTNRTSYWWKPLLAVSATALVVGVGSCLIGSAGNTWPLRDYARATFQLALIAFPLISAAFVSVTWIFWDEWHLTPFLEKPRIR